MTGFVVLRLALPCLFILIGIASAHTGPAALEYPSEKPSVDSGLDIYMHNCAGCHGEKGDGLGINGKVDFTNHMYMINRNSSEFFDVINDGTKNMPSFENVSKPRKWDSVAYVWTFWVDRPGAMRGKKNYAAIVEHETGETFMAMHLSEERQKAWETVEPLLDGSPTPNFYDVIIASEKKR